MVQDSLFASLTATGNVELVPSFHRVNLPAKTAPDAPSCSFWMSSRSSRRMMSRFWDELRLLRKTAFERGLLLEKRRRNTSFGVSFLFHKMMMTMIMMMIRRGRTIMATRAPVDKPPSLLDALTPGVVGTGAARGTKRQKDTNWEKEMIFWAAEKSFNWNSRIEV